MNDGKKKYDVVFFPDALKSGGAERVTIHLTDYLRGQGLRVAVMTTFDLGKNEYSVPDGVDRIDVGIREKKLFELIKGYYREIKKIDVGVAVLMGVPHGCYIIPACLMNRVKVVVSERNSPANYNGKKLTQKVMTFCMHYGCGYVFQTRDAMEYYKVGNKPKTVIANPLDASDYPIKLINESKKFENIISVGRLYTQKNQKLMIDAFSKVKQKYPNISLTIYGEGCLRSELEQMIEEYKLQNCVFLPGEVPDIKNKLENADIFLFSSDFEGIPNALLEAMAVGLPCISTDCPCGGPASVIENGINGLLVPVGDSSAMASALELLLTDGKLAKKIGKNAQQIRESLDIKIIGDKWVQFIKQFLND